ncbi:MAG TPA: hypothetical protein VK923_14045 [Euzebyales bacterium]|nr:hypothetical protein [Euzebyales bacterium]
MSAAQFAQRARDLAVTGAAFVLGGDNGAADRRKLLDAAIDDFDGLPAAARRQVLRRMVLLPAVVAWETLGSREDAWLAVAAYDLVPNAAGCARRASAAV